MKVTYKYLLMGFAMVTACTHDEQVATVEDSASIIHVGGVTRAAATDEGMGWLSEALKQGLNLSYYQTGDATKQQVKLKLEDAGNYSLTAEGEPAKWLGNGAHIFEGAYVPDGLKTEGEHTYADLSHYTATPPATKIAATVGSITIPLQHRLARVMAYVLIDNSMQTEISELHFCNVQTLKNVANGQPVWQKARKVAPNYLGVQKIEENVEQAKGFTEAPCYDLIVRPTYTHKDSVMYDEPDATEAAGENFENAIDFELKLANGLEYEKHFKFDLNANNETVVYLRVTPERIDYTSAGSRLWKEVAGSDDYYGVDNPGGHALSKAGSSWQRAFTNDNVEYINKDGETYQGHQYISTAEWINKLKLATTNGNFHGSYFILHSDIEIDVNQFPANFVFTGHLDALDHTITLKNVKAERNWLFSSIGSGWQAEVVNTKIAGGRLFQVSNDQLTGHVENCEDASGKVVHMPEIPTY